MFVTMCASCFVIVASVPLGRTNRLGSSTDTQLVATNWTVSAVNRLVLHSTFTLGNRKSWLVSVRTGMACPYAHVAQSKLNCQANNISAFTHNLSSLSFLGKIADQHSALVDLFLNHWRPCGIALTDFSDPSPVITQ